MTRPQRPIRARRGRLLLVGQHDGYSQLTDHLRQPPVCVSSSYATRGFWRVVCRRRSPAHG